MKNTFSLVLVFCICFLSCESFKNIGNLSGTNPNETNPKKNPSIKEQAETGYWVIPHSGNEIIIIGVSNGMVKPETEINAAKEDAARKISMFHGVSGSVVHYSRSGSRGFFDHESVYNQELIYDENYTRHIEQLKYDPEHDVHKLNNTVYIRFKYNVSMDAIQYTSGMDTDGRPEWIKGGNLPQFNGYITAVGISARQARLKDTLAKSSDAAVLGIVQQISTNVVDTFDTGIPGGTVGVTYLKSEAKVNNFLVLEFFIDQNTGMVYTLAIGKNAGS
jgi:hypothetical protein